MVSLEPQGTTEVPSVSCTTSPACQETTTTTAPSTSSTSTSSRSGGESQSRVRPQSAWNTGDTISKVTGHRWKEAKEAASATPPGPLSVAEAASATASCKKDVVEAPFANEMREAWLSEEDMRTLRRALEWYFSDTNLSVDQALHHKISQNLPEGWLCCSELMRLENLRQLGATPEWILKCLKKSHLEVKVTLTADEIHAAVGTPNEFGNRGLFVRRRQPLPPLLSRDRLRLASEAEVQVADPARFVLVDRHQTMNRLRDCWRVHRQLNLSEVGDDTTIFRERILPNVSPAHRPANGKPVIFAVGYERIVYGDHGPYIEFSQSQIRWKAWPHYFDKTKYNSYFNEFYTQASHSVWEEKWRMWDPHPTRGVLMMYAQSRPVSDRPWAPGAGSTDPHAGRPTGYADYRTGYFYVTADALMVSAERQEDRFAAWEVQNCS